MNTNKFYILDIASRQWHGKIGTLTLHLNVAKVFSHSQAVQILTEVNEIDTDVSIQAINAINPRQMYDKDDNEANLKVYLHLVGSMLDSLGITTDEKDKAKAITLFKQYVSIEGCIDSFAGLHSINQCVFVGEVY